MQSSPPARSRDRGRRANAAHPTFRVLRIESLPPSRSGVRALVDFAVGPITVRAARIVQTDDRTPAHLQMPQRSWIGADGRKMHAPVLELSRELHTAIAQAALVEWRGQGGRTA